MPARTLWRARSHDHLRSEAAHPGGDPQRGVVRLHQHTTDPADRREPQSSRPRARARAIRPGGAGAARHGLSQGAIAMSDETMRIAHTAAGDADEIVTDLRREIGDPPAMLALFFAPDRPGEAIAGRLAEQWPRTNIIGCSTAGEISTGQSRTGTVVAAGLGSSFVKRSAVAIADYARGVAEGIG